MNCSSVVALASSIPHHCPVAFAAGQELLSVRLHGEFHHLHSAPVSESHVLERRGADHDDDNVEPRKPLLAALAFLSTLAAIYTLTTQAATE